MEKVQAFSGNDVAVFTALTGDDNPIHRCPDAAAAALAGRTFPVGLQTVPLMAVYLLTLTMGQSSNRRFLGLCAPWHDVRLTLPGHHWQRLPRGCLFVSDRQVPAARAGERTAWPAPWPCASMHVVENMPMCRWQMR